MDDFIIFDLEWTTWKDAVKNSFNEPWQHREIIQMSALKIKNDKIVDTFDCLVKPVINPVLSKYAIGLTGITNEVLQKESLDFKIAYKKFHAFCGKLPCFSKSVSGMDNPKDKADGYVIEENISLNKMEKSPQLEYRNFARVIYGLAKEKGIEMKRMPSGEMAKSFGLEDGLKKHSSKSIHNALYDCFSLFLTWKYLKNV